MGPDPLAIGPVREVTVRLETTFPRDRTVTVRARPQLTPSQAIDRARQQAGIAPHQFRKGEVVE